MNRLQIFKSKKSDDVWQIFDSCQFYLNFFPGTTLIANYYSAHRDPKYFANAEQFDPDRFLDDTGAINKALVEKVIPYGLGMRRCGGEIVARLEIYTFIASLIHKCRIDESPDHPLDLNNYKTTVAIDPNPFKVIMRSRFNEWWSGKLCVYLLSIFLSFVDLLLFSKILR